MRRNDFVLLGALLIATAGLYYIWQPNDKSIAATVTVTVDSKPYGTYSLSQEQTVTIKSTADFNILTIKNGRAQITDANCPHKLCLQEKAIANTGETIVCVPHKVVITAHSEHKAQLDAVAR